MITTFIRLSFRKMWNDRSFTFLSITGLSLATVACATIWLFVGYERSFDEFRSRMSSVAYPWIREQACQTGRSALHVVHLPDLRPLGRKLNPGRSRCLRPTSTNRVHYGTEPSCNIVKRNSEEKHDLFAEGFSSPCFVSNDATRTPSRDKPFEHEEHRSHCRDFEREQYSHRSCAIGNH